MTAVCTREELWYYHVLVCFCVYLGGALVLAVSRLLWYMTRWNQLTNLWRESTVGLLRYKVAALIYGDSRQSKIYVSL